MSKPRRQHFLPKSALRPFADVKDAKNDKYFVEVGNVKTKEVKYPISITNICVSKNLYTLPEAEGDAKYLVEKFYAENIDSEYPHVYKLLTDPKIEDITDEQRHKVLNVILSLYFRNARFLQEKNIEVDEMIERMGRDDFGSDDSILFLQYEKRKYNFKRTDILKIKEEIKINNRIDFIIQHLSDWQKFVKLKDQSQIGVSKIIGDIKLITGDNPVRIYNEYGDTDDIFNPSNSIQFPLDQEHLLWISPNSKEWDRNRIYRQVRDKWFAITSNHSIAIYASEWIISKQGAVGRFFREMEQYNSFTPENKQNLDDIITISTELPKLLKFMEANGGPFSEASKKRLNELNKCPIFSKDPQFQIFYNEIVGS
ncbi:MAG: DUF4238 domain-containing protein [Bacteroidota bacterium]